MTRPQKNKLADDDRRTLLRRRALFLSAAVAATACGGATPGATNAPSTVSVDPVASEEPGEPSPPPERNVAPDGAAPPDIVIPADASADARRMYEHLKKQVTRVQIEVAAVARTMLTCTLADCQSDDAIEKIAREYATTSHLVADLTPLCPGSTQQAKLYQTVVTEQQKFFEAKLRLYRDKLLQSMRRDGDFQGKFEAAFSRADATRPMVCLDCMDW